MTIPEEHGISWISYLDGERFMSNLERWKADAIMNRAALCQVFDSIYRKLANFYRRRLS